MLFTYDFIGYKWIQKYKKFLIPGQRGIEVGCLLCFEYDLELFF